MKVLRESYRGWVVEDDEGNEYYVYITEKGMFCSCHSEPNLPCKHIIAVKEFEVSKKIDLTKAFNNPEYIYNPQV
jgi:hypothetical protein